MNCKHDSHSVEVSSTADTLLCICAGAVVTCEGASLVIEGFQAVLPGSPSRQPFQASPEVIDSLNKIVGSNSNTRSFQSVGSKLGMTTKGTAEGEEFAANECSNRYHSFSFQFDGF